MRTTTLDALPAVAARQAGVFTREQALAGGWTPAQVGHRISTGRWVRLAGRALVRAGAAVPPEGRVWAVHRTWPTATASHTTAAAVYRWPGVPADEVHAVAAAPIASLTDLRVHRLPLAPADVVRLEGGPAQLTSPERTAFDCLRTLPMAQAERLLAWLLTRGVITRADLAAEVARGFGTWGNRRLAQLLAATAGGALSQGERLLHAALRRAGLTDWVANATIEHGGRAVAVVDVLFRRAKLVIEFDGWAAHGNHAAFVADRRRQNALVALGYTVLRVTWADLVEREATVIAQICAALVR